MADDSITQHDSSGEAANERRRAYARERMRKVRAIFPERERERQRLWRENNRERDNEISRKSKARRKAQNPAEWNRKSAARARKLYAKDPQKHRDRHKAWHEKNRDRSRKRARRNSLLRNYGITPEQKEAMLLAQGGVCAICDSPNHNSNNWHVDHCHTTGVIRGILCGHCNCGIGYARDSIDILQRMINYLRKSHT